MRSSGWRFVTWGSYKSLPLSRVPTSYASLEKFERFEELTTSLEEYRRFQLLVARSLKLRRCVGPECAGVLDWRASVERTAAGKGSRRIQLGVSDLGAQRLLGFPSHLHPPRQLV
jgi:hypothetical protein